MVKSLDLVKNRENSTIFSEKYQYLKKCLYEPHTLSLNPWLSKRTYPNFLRIIQEPNFNTGFHLANYDSKILPGKFFQYPMIINRIFLKLSFSSVDVKNYNCINLFSRLIFLQYYLISINQFR
jgi:hypothetical protein